MKTITYESKDQNYQDETTIYWFNVDGELWGISDTNGERKLVDFENYPYDDSQLFDELSNMITEEMVQDA